MNGRLMCQAAILALVSLAMLVAPASADVASHPAHVHTGSCPDVADVVGPLEDVVGERMDLVGMADLATYPVRASVTGSVPIPYADLFATPHSIVVHLGASTNDLQVYLLCGNLAGNPLSASDIAVGLGQVDDSGFAGIATVHDNGDGTVDVNVYMTTRDAWVGDDY